MQHIFETAHILKPYQTKHHMRNGFKRNQIYLTFENLDHPFGFSSKAKRSQRKWKQNLEDKFLLAMMMDQNLSNITTRKRTMFLPLEICVSYLLQMTKPLRNQLGYYPMYRMRGRVREACR